MQPHLEEAWRLLRLADRDIKAFEVLKEAPDVHLSIIYFHTQQAVEKSLKAVLFLQQIEFARTHDLVKLARLLRNHGVMPPVTEDQLRRLTLSPLPSATMIWKLLPSHKKIRQAWSRRFVAGQRNR